MSRWAAILVPLYSGVLFSWLSVEAVAHDQAGMHDANTLLVPERYSTIQSAVDAARDGQVVSLSPGTYRESIDLASKSIAIVSRANASSTVIEGDGQSGLFTIRGGVVRIEGLTLRFGRPGVWVRAASVTLTGNIFEHNSTAANQPDGGAVLCADGALDVSGCSFSQNGASGRGGAIRIERSSMISRGNIFIDNSAQDGGAIDIDDGDLRSFDDLFVSNA